MELPPVIRIAVDEDLWDCASPEELKARLETTGLGKELRTQAEWTLDNFQYVDGVKEGDDSAGKFDLAIAPSIALNPFSPFGKCGGDTCSAEATNDFIKTIGLYSEISILPDPFTGTLASTRKFDRVAYENLLRSLKILRQTLPLVESNILLFGSPSLGFCEDHHKEFEKRIEEATKAILPDVRFENIEVWQRGSKHSLAVQLPMLSPDHNHPLTQVMPISSEEAALITGSKRKKHSKLTTSVLTRVIARRLKGDLTGVFLALSSAERLNALVVAGSRAETLFINALDQKPTHLPEIENWEKMRTVHLPWVQYLSAEEVLALREEAGIALPRLRELLRIRLTQPATAGGSNPLTDAVSELRDQALEVQSELDGLALPRERNYRTGMLGLAMMFVIYGLATQSPEIAGASVPALLAVLAHLRKTEREHGSKFSEITSTPAYALLKAKEIVARRS